MKNSHRAGAFLHLLSVFPLSLLNLAIGKRLLIVLLSYGLGILGLWFFFPRMHDGASMLLPIICLCWLFSYRGLLASLFATASAIWVIYHYLSGDTVPLQVIEERTIVAFGITLLLGLTICWLRTARQQALTAEQEYILALEREHLVTISYEQQRKLNEMKDQFILNVSHELRTPLDVLGGSLELLKEYHEALDPLVKAQMLARALASQEALVDLVNRVLDTTILVSDIPQVKPEAVCIHRLLQEVLAHLAPRYGEHYTFCLHVSEQTLVRADPQLLGQILQNLLSNIFKYVPRQTEIHIEATQATPSSPVCLSIQDAGPGIPVEELPLLFEKFVRLQRDLAGTTRGIGLGLYICKRFIEAMEGRIWVESTGRPGEGCRFCLTLPPFSPP